MTLDEAHDAYLAETDQPHGKFYAAAVGALQEAKLRDRVTDDLDEAFAMAVQDAVALLPYIRTAVRRAA